MRKTTLLLLSGLLLSTACTLPERPQKTEQSSSSSWSSTSQETQSAEEVGEHAPQTEERTETGALAERFLPTGVLELGDPSAPLTLLMFTEHHCSYCRQFLTEILPRLRTDFLEPGKVNLQIAMLTLQKYPASTDAALGFLCSAAQGKGYAMHEVLFHSPNKSREAILSYAVDLEINTKTLRECLKSARTKMLLEGQEAWAQSLGVTVVPTFFLSGEKFVGLPYYPDLRGRIEEALEKLKEQQ